MYILTEYSYFYLALFITASNEEIKGDVNQQEYFESFFNISFIY